MRHKRNPKEHDLPELVDSFKRWGFVSQPTLDEATQILVAGHGRCEALEMMRRAGMEPPMGIDLDARGEWLVPVVRGIEFENEKERDAYLIADNAHTMRSGWSDGMAEFLRDLEDVGFDGIGLIDDELEEWMGSVDVDLGDTGSGAGGREIDVTGHTRQIGGHKVRPPEQMTHDDYTLHLGKCEDGLKGLRDESIDAMVTDPPAGIGFMGRGWDSDKGGRDQWINWLAGVMAEAFRALKPGGHALVWALPRTSHWTGMALEKAGFEIRDRVSHLFLSGFPKSLDASKAVDAHLGKTDQRPVIEHRESGFDAAKWQGWGTAMKPALEDWWLVRKPLDGTVAENLLKHGVGALNIDANRIGEEGGSKSLPGAKPDEKTNYDGRVYNTNFGGSPPDPNVRIGRWPAHLTVEFGTQLEGIESPHLYFYCPKPSKSETEAGLQNLEPKTRAESTDRKEGTAGAQHARAGAGSRTGSRNFHPTKKPIELMRWLIRLITPKGGLVLDPFTGSGTTGLAALVEGCRFVGFEMNPEYHQIASERLRSIIDDPRTVEKADEHTEPDETTEAG